MAYSPRRRGPNNVSQYLANLNTVPSDSAPDDFASAGTSAIENDNDLSVFTNAEFFDFDVGDAPLEFNGSIEGDGRDLTMNNASASSLEFPVLIHLSPEIDRLCQVIDTRTCTSTPPP